MSQKSLFLKILLSLSYVLLSTALFLYAFQQARVQQHAIGRKDTAIEHLRKKEKDLQDKIAEAELQQKKMNEENATLKKGMSDFEKEKETILEQVRTSISNFDQIRAQALAEIERLKGENAKLEGERNQMIENLANEKKTAQEAAQNLEERIRKLNSTIVENQKASKALVKSLNERARSAVALDTAKAHYNLGNFYFRNSQYKMASKEYREAIAYRPNDPDVNFNYAVLCADFLNDEPTALKYFRRYIELRPNATDRKKVEQRILDIELKLRVLNEGKKAKDVTPVDTMDPAPSFSMMGDKK